jgi:hypothetical protein
MNANEIAPMTVEAQVFPLWYLASRPPHERFDESPFREAIEFFGDLHGISRSARLRVGAQKLADVKKTVNPSLGVCASALPAL